MFRAQEVMRQALGIVNDVFIVDEKAKISDKESEDKSDKTKAANKK